MSNILQSSLDERILLLDGATGTMQQRLNLAESDFRGKKFRDHPVDLKGNGDVLSLSQPSVVREIHNAYLKAGADIIETNTFTANRISQADYGLEEITRTMNVEAATIARQAADEYATSTKPRFVAGVLGPTTRAASISPDVEDPASRSIRFPELVGDYGESVAGLLEGGVLGPLLFNLVPDTLAQDLRVAGCVEVVNFSTRLGVEFSIDVKKLFILFTLSYKSEVCPFLTFYGRRGFKVPKTVSVSLGLNCSIAQ